MPAQLLELQRFLVKEQVGMLRTHDIYDIFDPDTQRQVGRAEEMISGFKKFLRVLINKKLMSTTVEVTDNDGSVCLSIHKPVGFLRVRVNVLNADGQLIGYFKSKLFSLGGGFWVYDTEDKQVAEVKGDWKGWNFKFLTPDGTQIGQVTKKWAGLGKELFTSADNYIVAIDDDLADHPTAKSLLLAAALAIDIVFKEGQ